MWVDNFAIFYFNSGPDEDDNGRPNAPELICIEVVLAASEPSLYTYKEGHGSSVGTRGQEREKGGNRRHKISASGEEKTVNAGSQEQRSR
jgi:hypothetical protein